jgi:dihydrodipicolinate synthase/N-acetylneuraminate lyase
MFQGETVEERRGAGVQVASMIAELADIPGIAGVKQATQNAVELDETMALAADKMALIGGAEAMIWPCLALGMIGNTATTASFWPESVVDIYDAAVRGDAHEAQAQYLRLAEYRMLCKAAGHAAVVKAGMDMVGLAGGPVRPPLPVMTEAHKEHLARILKDFGVLSSGARAAKA